MASTLLLPVVPSQLLGFAAVELEVVVLAPGCQSSLLMALDPCVTTQLVNRDARERAETRALMHAKEDAMVPLGSAWCQNPGM